MVCSGYYWLTKIGELAKGIFGGHFVGITANATAKEISVQEDSWRFKRYKKVSLILLFPMSVKSFEVITWGPHDSSNVLIVLIERNKGVFIIYTTMDHAPGEEGAICFSTGLIINMQCQNFIFTQALARINLLCLLQLQ